jgi:hypothetical protein
MGHPSSETFSPSLFVLEISSFILESIRLLDPTEITTLNRVDVAFSHVTRRRLVAMNQTAGSDRHVLSGVLVTGVFRIG